MCKRLASLKCHIVLEEKDSQSHNTVTLLLASNACFGLFFCSWKPLTQCVVTAAALA